MAQDIFTKINGRTYEYNGIDEFSALFPGDVLEAVGLSNLHTLQITSDLYFDRDGYGDLWLWSGYDDSATAIAAEFDTHPLVWNILRSLFGKDG